MPDWIGLEPELPDCRDQSPDCLLAFELGRCFVTVTLFQIVLSKVVGQANLHSLRFPPARVNPPTARAQHPLQQNPAQRASQNRQCTTIHLALVGRVAPSRADSRLLLR